MYQVEFRMTSGQHITIESASLAYPEGDYFVTLTDNQRWFLPSRLVNEITVTEVSS